MRFPIRSFAVAALTLACGACRNTDSLAPIAPRQPLLEMAAALPSVRFSEIHYDNTGTDAGEAIEISGPAGTDVTGWTIVLYNGTGGAPYSTVTLSGTIPATCDNRGVIVTNYAVNGIQNGSPDGMALVDASSTVVEFLSYEGTFTGVGGPANGLVSTDIGVSEAGTEALGQSLQRNGSGTWSGPSANTLGACNDNTAPPQPAVDHISVTPAAPSIVVGATQQLTATAFDAANQPIAGVVFTWTSEATAVATVSATGLALGVGTGTTTIKATAPNAVFGSASLTVTPASGLPSVLFSEIHYDNSGTDAGEAIEISGPAGVDLTGWQILLYNGDPASLAVYNTVTLSGTIPATCTDRGVIVTNYAVNGIQNGSPDGFALVNASGSVVEFLSYEGTFTAASGAAAGTLSKDIGVAELGSDAAGKSLQRDATGAWAGPANSTFGACNGASAPPAKSISFSGRVPTDPALPVGFEDQLFATENDGVGGSITTSFTWASETPLIASIDQNGVMRALAAGSAIFRATATDGTTGTFTLPTRVAVASATAVYAGNAAFGEPADDDASDDFIVRHPEYTASYNKNRNTPNWVSYDLEISHFGAEDRCDCFTFDPALPASFTRYTTNDYTGSGAAAGFGIDRGHLARSFDRTSASLDNAFTFYFSNIVPQAADLNQGPWANFENVLGDLARFSNKEVYVIAGVAGNSGTLKNEGKIVIPASTWKVAVIMPKDQGLANVTSLQSLEVIAVNMPNQPGIRNVDWNTYRTTVDAVEALSGYDLLALLPDQIEIAVESRTRPPIAVADGPYAGSEGSSIAMSAAGSSDADGQALTYSWNFGDGATATGANVSHTYAQDGTYSVQLTVTDPLTLTNTVTTSAVVANVTPVVSSSGSAVLFPGETYSTSGSFTDPGADSWTATVDYGDGSGTNALALVGKTFSLSHTYTAAGTFTVTVRVTDDDATASRTQTVTVLEPSAGIVSALALVDQLVTNGALNGGNGNALKSKLDNASQSLAKGDVNAALGQLGAFLNQLGAWEKNGTLSSSDSEPMHALVQRIIDSLGD